MDIYPFGSGECDQLGFGDTVFELKRPKLIEQFENASGLKFVSIVCGGMHTLALTTKGEVFSWGCNDDGALGRGGTDNRPSQVTIPFPVENIAAGESHSVAWNRTLNRLVYWGTYRDPHAGPISDKIKEPLEMKSDNWGCTQLDKVVCGSNHTILLSDKTLYSWGNYTDYQLGRFVGKRNQKEKALTPGPLATKGVVDVFVGKNQNFCISKSGKKLQIKAWGANGCGQLGFGHKNLVIYPTVLENEKLKKIKAVAGGDYFSVFLTEEGRLYTVGKNDQNQLGIGTSNKTVVNEDGQLEREFVHLDLNEVSGDKDMLSLPAIKEVVCSNDFTYAISEKVFSWGFGENCVLGNRKDENEERPYRIADEMFKEKKLRSVSVGAQHVVFGMTEGEEELKLEIQYEAPVSKKRPVKRRKATKMKK